MVAGLLSCALFVSKFLYGFYGRVAVEAAQLEQVRAKYQAAAADNAALSQEQQYYQRPENVEKELRARFNYRRSDEKLMILVPEESASASTTSSTTP